VPSVSGVARKASSAATDEAVEEATDAESRRRLLSVVEDPRVKEATREMVEQTMSGVVETLDSEPVRKQMGRITTTLTDAFVDQIVTSLSSPGTQQKLMHATGAFADAAFAQAADSMRQQLGPAMRDVVQQDLAPAMRSSLDDQMNQTLGHTAQRVAYSAVLGANEGLGDAFSSGFGRDMRSWTGTGMTLLYMALAGLGLLTLMLLSLAVMAMARARRARSDVQRLENATLLLATAMRERHESTETTEIVELVRAALHDNVESHGRHRLLDALSLRHHH
jgi:hypothetical protein